MLIFLWLLWLLIHIGLFFSIWSYPYELIISFLPYIISIDSLIGILFLVKFIGQRRWITFLLLIFYAGVSIYYINQYIDTYLNNKQENTIIQQWTGQNINFFYSNIYYKNKDFSWLIESIQSHQPDIVLLVEYAKIHDETLTPLLKEQYPYKSRYIGQKWYDGDIIFSKYPLKTIKHTVYPGSFSHISIEYRDQEYDFALIHTSAPVSEYFFNMRNKQLDELSELLQEHYTIEKRDHPIFLLWDFNITPRSSYYTSFASEMNKIGLDDITTNKSITTYDSLFPYSRCHESLSIACSHIDHVRSNTKSVSLQKITIPWSDHFGFIGTI